jgi:glycosyltransferase involved in cell wall biosynthesis
VFSIVSITWNNIAGLAKTVRSFRAQELPDGEDVELIVVDNMSDDGTEDFMSTVKDARIRYLRAPDDGIYHAMNKGTDAARGDRILYLNGGDAFHDTGSLAHMVAGSADLPGTGTMAVFGALKVDKPDGHGDEVIPNLPHRWLRHAYGAQPHAHASTVFDAASVRAAGGYSLDFGFVSDFDLVMRLGLLGKVLEDPTVVVDYDANGISSKRWKEIPDLLHVVRVTRFGVGTDGMGARADKMIAWLYQRRKR